MIESFIFAGKSSDTMGVIMSKEWIPTKPEIRYETTEIDGRDGAIIEKKGYSMVQRDIECTLMNRTKLNDVVAWLNGDGVFEFNGRYCNAHIYSSVDYENLGINKCSFTIPFLFEPFWYREDGYHLYKDGETVENKGNYDATPMIEITGSGSGAITVGDTDINIIELKESEVLLVDCLEMSENLPTRVGIGFEYPRLKPGKNVLGITGALQVRIKRKDRWLA